MASLPVTYLSNNASSSTFAATFQLSSSQTSYLTSYLSTSFTTTQYLITSNLLNSTAFNHGTSSKNVLNSTITKTQSFVYSTSVFSSSIQPQTNTTTAAPPISSHGRPKLLYYVGIPAVLIGLVLLSILIVKACKWYRRRKRLQKEFAPCYSYDQSENEVVDGIIYPSGTNSLDILTIDATPPVQRHLTTNPEDDEDDDDESCLLTNTREMDDFSSDTQRCDSIAV